MAHVELFNQGAAAEVSLPDVEAEADHCIKLVLTGRDIESFYYSDDGRLYIGVEPRVSLGLRARIAKMYFRSRMAPADRGNTPLIGVRGQATLLEALNEREPGVA